MRGASARVRVAHATSSYLRGPRFGAIQLPRLEYPRIQPLTDQSRQHAIAHPTAKHLTQLAVIDRVEIPPHVDLDHPAATHRHQLAVHGLQRLTPDVQG
jgi:hypothetical protein